MSTHNLIKNMTWRQARTNKLEYRASVSKTFSKKDPKITLKSMKILFRPPRVHPAGPMVFQGAPEMLKWSPRKSKWTHQAPQMVTPRSQKRLAAEGVAVKITNHRHFSGSPSTHCNGDPRNITSPEIVQVNMLQ